MTDPEKELFAKEKTRSGNKTHESLGTWCDMVSTCESYLNALRAGYPLWEV